jgi:hypothetical protein
VRRIDSLTQMRVRLTHATTQVSPTSLERIQQAWAGVPSDLCVGDLAFLALCLGMVSSDSYHCIFCERKGRTFNCDYHAEEQRTNDKILTCHLEFEADFQRHELRRTKQTINNVNKGINSQFLRSQSIQSKSSFQFFTSQWV